MYYCQVESRTSCNNYRERFMVFIATVNKTTLQVYRDGQRYQWRKPGYNVPGENH